MRARDVNALVSLITNQHEPTIPSRSPTSVSLLASVGRSRACSAILHGLYSRLLDRMEQRGFDVYRERVRLSSGEKLRITAKLWTASLLPRRNPD